MTPLPKCLVCAESDARKLTRIHLCSGTAVTLCGSHALMRERLAPEAVTLDELALALRERRTERERRASGADELAWALQVAFSPDNRGAERRASRRGLS